VTLRKTLCLKYAKITQDISSLLSGDRLYGPQAAASVCVCVCVDDEVEDEELPARLCANQPKFG